MRPKATTSPSPSSPRGDVGSPTLSRAQIAAVREQEARNAAAVIGAEFYWLGYDDEFLYDSPEVRRHFIDVLRLFPAGHRSLPRQGQ